MASRARHARDTVDHATHVAAWFEGVAKGRPPTERELFQRAMDALCERARSTLGVVTLTAILDRVLYTAAERHPWLSALKVEGAGIRWAQLPHGGGAREERVAFAFVLVELLTVLGNLTDEILTPALHATLASVARESTADVARGTTMGSGGVHVGDGAATPRRVQR